MTSVLAIISSGYRATAEEQDDAAMWFLGMCAKDLDVHVLLAGNATTYASVTPDAPAELNLAGAPAARPPHMSAELARLVGHGAKASYLAEDATRYGVDTATVVTGVAAVNAADLAALIESHDHTWNFR